MSAQLLTTLTKWNLRTFGIRSDECRTAETHIPSSMSRWQRSAALYLFWAKGMEASDVIDRGQGGRI